MPDWLSFLIGFVVGAAVIFGAVFLAVRPYMWPRKPKSWMADPNGKRDEIETWVNSPPPGVD